MSVAPRQHTGTSFDSHSPRASPTKSSKKWTGGMWWCPQDKTWQLFKDLSSHWEGPILSFKAPRIYLHALRAFHAKIFYKTEKNQLRKIKYFKWEISSESPWKQCHQHRDRFAWVKVISHCVLLLSLKMFKEGQLCICFSSVCGLEWVLVQMGLFWNEVLYASFGINPQV